MNKKQAIINTLNRLVKRNQKDYYLQAETSHTPAIIRWAYKNTHIGVIREDIVDHKVKLGDLEGYPEDLKKALSTIMDYYKDTYSLNENNSFVLILRELNAENQRRSQKVEGNTLQTSQESLEEDLQEDTD